MFVVSLSSKKIKKIAVACLCLIVVAGSFVFLGRGVSDNNNTALTANAKVPDSAAILGFISSHGWEVSEEPDEVREVVIPAEFDDVYKNYNEIQLAQGYDLIDYAGERVKKWTYTINNYPGYIGEECIKINILVYDGIVIGGDVCSVRLDGFMHGFSKEV